VESKPVSISCGPPYRDNIERILPPGRLHRSRLYRRTAFPLNQLFVAVALIALIAGGLYWFGGAWGMALLWGAAALFVLPLAAAPIGLFLKGREKVRGRNRPEVAAYLLGALLAGLAWMAAVAYFAYRGYAAVP
jgi:hypothetical protein